MNEAEALATIARARTTARPPHHIDGHCGRAGCRCTHTEGCDRGWVDVPSYTDPRTLQTYSPVAPCPVCRPERFDLYARGVERGSVNTA